MTKNIFLSADGGSPNCTNAPNADIIYQDPSTCIFKSSDGTWYLNDGTPIDDFDPNTGAYQEGGDWYTFNGVSLMAYDKNTGNYQEMDGSCYQSNGATLTDCPAPLKSQTPVVSPLLNVLTSVLSATKANKSVVNNNTIKPTNYIAPKATTTSYTVPLLVGAVVVGGIVAFMYYKKKK